MGDLADQRAFVVGTGGRLKRIGKREQILKQCHFMLDQVIPKIPKAPKARQGFGDTIISRFALGLVDSYREFMIAAQRLIIAA